jgi:hypothetical protein
MIPIVHRPRLSVNALPTFSAIAWVAMAAALVTPLASRANDFPTVDRVLYVQECMRNHPGPHYEMVNKCACAQDKLSEEVSFDDYVTMATATNANSIGGERGNTIRDAGNLQTLIKRYRELQAKVTKACFIQLP